MQIHGFNKTTLLDYPGIVASTIFTGACNYRCPFCQNADLVLDPASQPIISEDEIFAHFRKRKGIVEGVCITGGEPTLQKDLYEFVKKCKDEGLKVKLDSNGTNPEILKKLVGDGLLDYVAMDIKSSPEGYAKASGVNADISLIKESVDFLINGNLPFEFRTTVVRELHDAQTMKDIAQFIDGAKNYFLQGFVDSERVIQSGLSAYSREELEAFLPLFEGHVANVSIRGVD